MDLVTDRKEGRKPDLITNNENSKQKLCAASGYAKHIQHTTQATV